MQKKPGYSLFLGLSALCTVAAILTLIPYASASAPSLLGYRSLCSFAPISTFFCLALAATSCKVRKKLFTF